MTDEAIRPLRRRMSTGSPYIEPRGARQTLWKPACQSARASTPLFVVARR